MNTLYRKFSSAALVLLILSVCIGFILANVVYFTTVKADVDAKNVETAQEIANMLHYGDEAQTLTSIGKLGYQLMVISEQGEMRTYGEDFTKQTLPNEAKELVFNGQVYHGMQQFSGMLFMMGHFSNDVENTVGVPFTKNDTKYGLFLRPNNQTLFSEMHIVLVGFILAISIVSLVGVFLMTRQVLKPITQLTEATKAVINENFNYSLNIARNDEIGQLADSFAKMQQQLAHNDDARKAFISNVSHDFQSPLMNIQGYAELLQNGITEQERVEYSQIIDNEAKRLSNLTKQLLLLTSLDQATYPLQMQEVRIDEQLREVIRKSSWRIAELEMELSYELQPAYLTADPELLLNVWDNLLSNALKYTKPGGTIYISCESRLHDLKIECRDSGIGLSQDEMEQVFERFYRVDKARKKDGTGLGLAISKQIVALHGGRIKVESSPDQGSTFTVYLPFKKATLNA